MGRCDEEEEQLVSVQSVATFSSLCFSSKVLMGQPGPRRAGLKWH